MLYTIIEYNIMSLVNSSLKPLSPISPIFITSLKFLLYIYSYPSDFTLRSLRLLLYSPALALHFMDISINCYCTIRENSGLVVVYLTNLIDSKNRLNYGRF